MPPALEMESQPLDKRSPSYFHFCTVRFMYYEYFPPVCSLPIYFLNCAVLRGSIFYFYEILIYSLLWGLLFFTFP